MPTRLWIGGKVPAPLYVTDPEPRRPDFVVWIDTTSGKIVEGEITEPAESTATLVSCLSKAFHERKVSRPNRIRVADVSIAEAVRAVVGESIAIEIAPTPELTQVVESMASFLDSTDRDSSDGEDLSYFENGRVPPATVTRFFEVAARLYRVKPWNSLWDADTIGLDIPAFGLARVVLSVLGRAGQNFGFAIFDSASSFDAFCAAGSDPVRRKNDLGTSLLSLNFESKSRIPSSMLREISRHGWKVAGPKAYPYVMAVDRDHVHRPLRERDMLMVCAAAEGLAQFIAKHGRQLSPEMSDTRDSPSLTNGCFDLPAMRDASGRFRVEYRHPSGATKTRLVTKDASDYFVGLEAPPLVGVPGRGVAAWTLRAIPSVTQSGSYLSFGKVLEDLGSVTVYDGGGAGTEQDSCLRRNDGNEVGLHGFARTPARKWALLGPASSRGGYRPVPSRRTPLRLRAATVRRPRAGAPAQRTERARSRAPLEVFRYGSAQHSDLSRERRAVRAHDLENVKAARGTASGLCISPPLQHVAPGALLFVG